MEEFYSTFLQGGAILDPTRNDLCVIRLYQQQLPLVLLQYFLTMNRQRLGSNLSFLEIKVCGKMMVIIIYFNDELQSLKNDHYASN